MISIRSFANTYCQLSSSGGTRTTVLGFISIGEKQEKDMVRMEGLGLAFDQLVCKPLLRNCVPKPE